MQKIFIKVALIPLSFFIFMLGCSEDSGPNYVDQITYDSPEEADDALNNLDISCEDPQKCIEAVGGLVSLTKVSAYTAYIGYQTKYLLSTCSQTLIGPDRVLTNRHCLPKDRKSKGSSCSEITFIFPATEKRPAERAGCQSVIDLSPHYPGSVDAPDWAILQLDRSIDRTPIEITTSGVNNKAQLTAFPVYYEKLEIDQSSYSVKAVVKGEIKNISCTSEMSNYFSPHYNHPQSSMVSLNCNNEIIKGNSGSGFLSSEGRLAGVISTTIRPDKKGVSFMGSWHKIKGHIGGGTNSQCISGLNGSVSPACAYSRKNLGLGIFFSIIYGQITEENVAQEINNFIISDSSIQWEDHNEDFFSKIKSAKFFSKLTKKMPSIVAEYGYSFGNSSDYPKTPLCIDSSLKPEGSFALKVPALQYNYKKMTVSQKALYVVPRELSFLELNMNYDSNKNYFIGKLSRLENNIKEKFLELEKGKEKVFATCLFGGFQSDCSNYYDLDKKVNNFKKDSGINLNLFTNESFINENDLGTAMISIPVCDENI